MDRHRRSEIDEGMGVSNPGGRRDDCFPARHLTGMDLSVIKDDIRDSLCYSKSELRWRLRLVYDRQELYDILQYLLDEGFLRASDSKIDGQLVQTLEEDEEIEVFYFLCERKKWYLSM